MYHCVKTAVRLRDARLPLQKPLEYILVETHLVTGSSGFLGQTTISKLLSLGHRVIAIDVIEDKSLDPRVIFHRVDVRDLESLNSIMVGVDVVHHLAALVPLTKAYNEFWSVNVEGSETVAKAARLNGVRAFVHTSSSAVYGKTTNEAITRETPLRPIEPYGESKLQGELAVKRILSDSKVQLVVIRPRTILGDGRGGIFELFFKWIEESKPIFTVGDGNKLFQFVHIDDLISATFCALNSGLSGDFNVGTENYGTLNQAFETLIERTGSRSPIVHLPVWATVNGLRLLEKLKLSPLAPWHYMTFHFPFFFDLSPLTSIGWKSTYSNDELFIAAYNDYMSRDHSVSDDEMSPHRKKLDAKALTLIQKLLTPRK